MLNMQTPENVREETILRMAAYVGKFIKNLSDLCSPLRDAES